MMGAIGLGWPGATLLALATITTNFVNIYLSGLAWKSLLPRAGEQASIWSIGLIGTALGLFSGAWLTGYADFMLVLGNVLVPVGGVLLAHYFLGRRVTHVPDLYDATGPYARGGGVRPAGAIAWALGAVVYAIAGSHGATLPSLATAVVTYALLARRLAR
jgi:cytosine permease